MKKIFYLSFPLFLSIPLFCQCQTPPTDRRVKTTTTTMTADVEIIFETEYGMFPSSWYKGDIQGKAVSLDKSEIARSKRIIAKAMEKYPKGFVEKNLKKIYVLRSLNFYGVEYGGTYYESTLYITNNGEEHNYTDLYVEQVFHHEFSSILLENYPDNFDKYTWNEINGESFEYGDGGVNAIISGTAGNTFTIQLNEEGFLTEYSKASMEEDVNVLAANLFKANPSFWGITEEYDKIGRKMELLVNFYQSLDPQFTKEYFQQISEE